MPFLCDCQLFQINWAGYRLPVEKRGESRPPPLAFKQQWLFFDPHCPFTPTCLQPPSSVRALFVPFSQAHFCVSSHLCANSSYICLPSARSVRTYCLPGPLHTRPHLSLRYLSEVAAFPLPIWGTMRGWGSWGSWRLRYVTKAVPGNNGLTGVWTQAGLALEPFCVTQSCTCQPPHRADSSRLLGL